jgi:lysophospholipase L1-like esterase
VKRQAGVSETSRACTAALIIFMTIFAFIRCRAALAQGFSEESCTSASADWANLGRYRMMNAALSEAGPASEHRIVFLGDSLTEYWGEKAGHWFPQARFINRGIGGQTTGQMLLRFRNDVIELHPWAVVILGGSNDMRLGHSDREIENNLTSMAELAQLNGIHVFMASITPVCDCFASRSVNRSSERIRGVNTWIREYCVSRHFVYVDYYSALADAQGRMRREFTVDGVHLNDVGYEKIQRIIEPLMH